MFYFLHKDDKMDKFMEDSTAENYQQWSDEKEELFSKLGKGVLPFIYSIPVGGCFILNYDTRSQIFRIDKVKNKIDMLKQKASYYHEVVVEEFYAGNYRFFHSKMLSEKERLLTDILYFLKRSVTTLADVFHYWNSRDMGYPRHDSFAQTAYLHFSFKINEEENKQIMKIIKKMDSLPLIPSNEDIERYLEPFNPFNNFKLKWLNEKGHLAYQVLRG